MTLSEKFKELRLKLKLTQVEAADLLGIHAQTISRWETGVEECAFLYLLGLQYHAAIIKNSKTTQRSKHKIAWDIFVQCRQNMKDMGL